MYKPTMKEKAEAWKRIQKRAKQMKDSPNYPFKGMSTQEILDFMREKMKETKSQS